MLAILNVNSYLTRVLQDLHSTSVSCYHIAPCADGQLHGLVSLCWTMKSEANTGSNRKPGSCNLFTLSFTLVIQHVNGTCVPLEKDFSRKYNSLSWLFYLCNGYYNMICVCVCGPKYHSPHGWMSKQNAYSYL